MWKVEPKQADRWTEEIIWELEQNEEWKIGIQSRKNHESG